MFLNSRRFSVWLVSFLAVMVVYFIYNRVSRTPKITHSGRGAKPGVHVISDSCESDGGVGRVGKVGIGGVKNVRYTKLDANKQVTGEFGFEELLHQDGNDWEIEEPYYTMYRPGFVVTLRGDRARVTVETAGGRITPKHGLLTGNVTIQIQPKGRAATGSSVVYLDDIFFVGEKSLFSTTGTIEFISQDARLTGTGMELIYDGDMERLNLLKIRRLENLSIKRWSKGFILNPGTSTGDAGKSGERQKEKEGQKYRCVLENGVVIETLRERLLAEMVLIENIFVAGGLHGEHDAAKAAEEIAQGAADVPAMTRSAAGWSQTPAADEEGDVVISCKGGVTITPTDSAIASESMTVETDCEHALEHRRDGRATICAGRIDYDAASGVAVAPGFSQITFDAIDTGQKVPATAVITTGREMRFEPAAKQVSFEGDSRCTITQPDGNAVRQYFVLGNKLEVILSEQEASKGGRTIDISRLAAMGGDVRLAGTKKIGERLLTGTELKCERIDYDVLSRDFLATGPGLIKVDNSQTDEPQGKLPRLSLRRKCYAFLRNFETLEFIGGTNRIIADSNGGSLLIDYLPFVESGEEDKVAITASQVEAEITETPAGRMELGSLVARGAVTYEDKDLEFAGNELIFDANGGSINITGDKSRPALFNNAVVPGIQYDFRTGRVNTRIIGPGAIK